jgi:DNA-binding response OmpR family regulator
LIAFTKEAFDICILDVMMPKKDGFTLGKEIRKINPHIPLIFATAKTMIEDKTEAFTLGGDDYITKPFRIEELLLRINALLKRVSEHKNAETNVQQSSFQIGDFVFDVAAQQITYKENTQRLSTKEAELLKLLCQKQNQVLTREEALLAIWHDDNYFNGRSMDVFLSKLRKYLKADPKVEIMNVHGRGYKLFIH